MGVIISILQIAVALFIGITILVGVAMLIGYTGVLISRRRKIRSKAKSFLVPVLMIIGAFSFTLVPYRMFHLLPLIPTIASIVLIIWIFRRAKKKPIEKETEREISPYEEITRGTFLMGFNIIGGTPYSAFGFDMLLGSGKMPDFGYNVSVLPPVINLEDFYYRKDDKYAMPEMNSKLYTSHYRGGSSDITSQLKTLWKQQKNKVDLAFSRYCCLRITALEDTKLTPADMEYFWANLHSNFRVIFEIIASTKDGIVFQLLCHQEDKLKTITLLKQLSLNISEDPDALLGFFAEGDLDWEKIEDNPDHGHIFQHHTIFGQALGLNYHYGVPLKTYKNFTHDPHLPLMEALGAMLKRHQDACMALQAIIEPSNGFYEAHLANIDNMYYQGQNDYDNVNPRAKLEYPLFGVALRQLFFYHIPDKYEDILEGMHATLQENVPDISLAFATPFEGDNAITRGSLGEIFDNVYLPEAFANVETKLGVQEITQALKRNIRRPGCILNSLELANLCHFPHAGMTHELLDTAEKVVLPEEFKMNGTLVGQFEGKKRNEPCYVPDEWRGSHTYVIGYTGMGKTTLLLNMIKQDIEIGHGVGIIDVKGKDAKSGRYFVDEVLRLVPKGRAKDVVLFDATDLSYPIGFNLIDNKQKMSKNILTQRLFAALERATESAWPDQMQLMFTRAVEALLNDPETHTLLDIELMLYDDAFRYNVLSHLADTYQRNYWDKIFPETGKATRDGIARRMAEILGDENSRNVLCQPKMAFDFREVMDTKKIFLAKIPRGNYPITYKFFAKMLMIYFELASMSREQGHPFCLYIDEFQHFADETFQEVINEARSAGIWLTMSHQQTDQIDSKTLGACMSTGTTIVFQVQPQDARRLEPFFSPNYKETDIMNLGKFHTLTRIGKSQNAFRMATIPIEYPETDYTEQIKINNRVLYCGEKLKDAVLPEDAFNFISEAPEGEPEPPRK